MNIPKTIKSAEAKLTKLDGIVSASQWERAAIVYAFTEEGEVGGDPTTAAKVRSDLGVMSFREFAALGIVGLKSKNTVLKYHEAWQSAIDDGEALPIAPGDAFNEPELDFPPAVRTSRQAGASVPRTSDALKDDNFIEEVVENMEVADLIPLINKAQKKVDASTPSKKVAKRDGLDTAVSALEMRVAVNDLKAAEPAWSQDVRSNVISHEIADGILGDLKLIVELVSIAANGEMSNPEELLR